MLDAHPIDHASNCDYHTAVGDVTMKSKKQLFLNLYLLKEKNNFLLAQKPLPT